MKTNYLNLFDELKKEHEETSALSTNSRTLVVDGTNTFIRAVMADPTTNENGIHVGGITGFLKSIGHAIKMLRPTRCIVVFDGKGGSQKRKKLYPDYKLHRNTTVKYNRSKGLMNPEDEAESMKMQLGRLAQYLKCLPLTLIAIDNIEADDTIAYIATHPLDGEDNLYYIMSSDKDFYQLISEKVNVWSPTKKKLYDAKTLFDEYGITSNNFIMYRILDGDKSDNIDGVRGVGLKTIQKRLPMLCEQKTVTVDDLIDFSTGKEEKIYKSVASSRELLERNFKLMQLADVDISGGAEQRITSNIRKEIPEFNRWTFKTMVLEDFINGAFPQLEYWLRECFEQLNSYR